MTSATGRRAAGQTLIEVLVAVAVFFGGVTAVLRAFASVAAALELAADSRRADALLREKIADVELLGRTGGALPAVEEGGFEQAPAYRWSLSVDRPVAPGATGLFECSVTVWRESRGRRHTIRTWLAGAGP
jgi:hypothetical protein